jgi:serine/threonine protein kinase
MDWLQAHASVRLKFSLRSAPAAWERSIERSDQKLKRDVALKVLPAALASDPVRMALFQREAEVLASLNHPISEQSTALKEGALVMELVAGDSPKGPLPFKEPGPLPHRSPRAGIRPMKKAWSTAT